jgi:hypothetical protein
MFAHRPFSNEGGFFVWWDCNYKVNSVYFHCIFPCFEQVRPDSIGADFALVETAISRIHLLLLMTDVTQC